MDRVTRGEDQETDGDKEEGLAPVTLRTQGTIMSSDRSIRTAGKAGIRPVGKAGARVSSLGGEGEAGKAEASKTGKAEAGNAGVRRVGWVACLTLETWLRGGGGRENVCKGVGGQGRHAVKGEKKLRGRENPTGTPILGLPPVPTSVRALFISGVYCGDALIILHTAPWWVLFHPWSQQ
jgi:hypothetical protein